MVDSACTRRTFLARFAALGAGASTFLTACGGGAGSGGATGAPVVEASTCRRYSAASVPVRASLGYVDRSPIPEQLCANCRFYIAPIGAGDRCGGCQLIPGTNGNGPVSPGGYCRSWTAAPAS